MYYQELKQLEDDLWEAADQLRANSKLTASEYSIPVLGRIGVSSNIPAKCCNVN
jgi:type I restriction enzyme M protein